MPPDTTDPPDPSALPWPAAWTGDALRVAPLLLGAVLGHAGVGVRLTELEAYRGSEDPASHAFRGKTPRTAPMFGPPGHLYVYLSYGIHRAANIVTTPAGTASGVLLRAGAVVSGNELAHARRPGVSDARLAQGPGNLGRALAFDLVDSGRRIFVCADLDDLRRQPPETIAIVPPRGPVDAVASGPRVGVGAAHDEPWRFWISGDPSVSAYRRQVVRKRG